MNKEDIRELKIDVDYTYCYPYGPRGDAQLKCLQGKHEGLILDITSSALIDINYDDYTDKSFKYDYKILKVWNNIDSSKFDGRNIKLDEKDQNHISSMVYQFITEFLKNDENRMMGNKIVDNFKEKY